MTETPTLWLSSQQANTTDSGTTGDDQTGIQLVGLANGNIVALWQSNTDDGAGSSVGTDIIGQLYDAEGNPIGGEFRANGYYVADDEGVFEAAALPNGNFVVVYEDTDIDGTSLRYTVLDPNGLAVTTRTIAADPGANDLGDPSVTVNADGSFLVAYQEINAGADMTRTSGVIVQGDGTTVGSPISLMAAATSTNVGTQQVDVATLTNGDYVIVSRDTGADNALAMRIISSTGVNVLSFTNIATSNFNNDFAPAVAALSGGGYVVAWQSNNFGDLLEDHIRYQVFTAAGAAVGAEQGIGPGFDELNSTPELIGLSDGGYVMVFDHNDSDGIVGLQRFNATGGKLGDEIVVAAEDGITSTGSPTVTLSEDGRLLIGWDTSVRTTGSLRVDTDVHFSIFDPRENTITGDGGNNVITSRLDGSMVDGLGGADTLLGQGSADTLRGGNGDDRLCGGAGADYLSGGTGFDTAQYYDAPSGVVASLANPSINTGYAAGDTYNSIEGLWGSAYADTLNGNNGANTILARHGNDTVKGYAGNDFLAGEWGNDTLIGGAGADQLNGGDNTDTASYAGAAARVTVSLANPSINTGDAAGDTFSSIENLTGTDFDDYLFGDNDVNVINGGTGHDIIKSYGGSDILQGWTGKDIFVFNSALNAMTNVDTLADYNAAADTIQLDNAIFAALTAAGTLAASAFKDIASSVKDASDRIIYNSDTGGLYYDADGSGGVYGNVKFAVIGTQVVLTAADFVVI